MSSSIFILLYQYVLTLEEVEDTVETGDMVTGVMATEDLVVERGALVVADTEVEDTHQEAATEIIGNKLMQLY